MRRGRFNGGSQKHSTTNTSVPASPVRGPPGKAADTRRAIRNREGRRPACDAVRLVVMISCVEALIFQLRVLGTEGAGRAPNDGRVLPLFANRARSNGAGRRVRALLAGLCGGGGGGEGVRG